MAERTKKGFRGDNIETEKGKRLSACRLWDFALHFTCHCLEKTWNLLNGQS